MYLTHVYKTMIKTEIPSSDSTNFTVREMISTDPASPLLFILPAMGAKARYYEPFGQQLNAQGYHVVIPDWRGNGDFPEKPSRQHNFGYKELLLDLNQVVNFYKHKFPDRKMIIAGHSLGGQLGSLFTAQYPDQIDALILIAACSIYYKGWDGFGRVKVLLAANVFPLIANLFGYFPGDKFQFAGREAQTVIHDWSATIRTGKYQPIGSTFDYEPALNRLRKKILAFSIENDDLATVKAVHNLLAKFNPQSEIKHVHLTSEETGVKQINHFNWAKRSDFIVAQIADWESRF